MRSTLDSTGHRVPRTKPTCLLHTWRPHRRRPFALVLPMHPHQSSYNLHLQYVAKNQSTQRCQSLITPGSDHPPVLKPHMVPSLPFLPPCGPHSTPLATGSLEQSLLVFSTPGGLTGDDLSCLFFTCTNTSQATTCTCNTAKNQSTQHCQSLITPGSDHPPILKPHMVLTNLH
jgi:hypothetical protein